jgi:AcrR family transcriptional regulator
VFDDPDRDSSGVRGIDRSHIEGTVLPRTRTAGTVPSPTAVALPPTTKGAKTRAKLVKAAKEVFERDGFLEARISDIAKRAKVSYGAFYHYFDSKEQIFREVAEAQEERLTAPPDEDTEPLSEPGDPTVYDRIYRANRRYLERYRSEAKIMGVIEQVSRYDSYVNAARMASQKHFVERSERAIKQLQKEGQADPRLDPAMASDALGAMVARFAELWLTQGYRSYDFDQAVEQLTIIWANALGLPSGQMHPSKPTPRRSTRATTRTT